MITINNETKYHQIIKRDNLIYTDQETIQKVYKLVYDVKRLLTAYKITYWADGGTMLGAVRHQGIIPWDEDADLKILDTEEDQIEKLRKPLENYNYELMKTWFGYKIFPKDGKKVKGYKWKFPSLDLFTVSFDKDNKMIYKYPKSQKIFGKCWATYKNIFPLKKEKFGSFYINVPKKPEIYLAQCYGSDWYDVGYMQYDHENEKAHKKIKVELTDEDRVPAIPFYP